MPRTTREWALRKMSAADNNIEWCQIHLAKVIDRYLETHPEVSAPLLTCVELSDVLRQAIMKVRGSI